MNIRGMKATPKMKKKKNEEDAFDLVEVQLEWAEISTYKSCQYNPVYSRVDRIAVVGSSIPIYVRIHMIHWDAQNKRTQEPVRDKPVLI